MQWNKVEVKSNPSKRYTYNVGDQLELKGFIAKALKKQLEMDIFFRNIEITKVEAESFGAVLISFRFLSKIAESCHSCGKALDDEVSKATGIGPICFKKLKLAVKPTKENAHLIIKELERLIEFVGEVVPVWVPKSQIKQRIENDSKDLTQDQAGHY